MMKPGSTVGDVFEALKHGALHGFQANGELVRSEGRGLERNGRRRQLGRDAPVDESCCVLRILTNRKSVWQNLPR